MLVHSEGQEPIREMETNRLRSVKFTGRRKQRLEGKGSLEWKFKVRR